MPYWKATYWQEKLPDLFTFVTTADKNLIYKNTNTSSLTYRALEKVDKQQLNWKWFEICQTISCFGAFLLTLSLTKIPKLASKSVKLCTLMQIFIESIYVKFLPTLLEKIHTSPPSPSLTYFQVQLFPSPYLAYASYSTEKSASTAGKNNQLHRCTP